MKNEKKSSSKLKIIAVLSAITICSSVGVSSIKASAGIFSSKPSTTTNSSGFRSSLSRFANAIPKVELNISDFGRDLRAAWKNFKGIFTSSSKSQKVATNNKTNISGVQNQGFAPSTEDIKGALDKVKGNNTSTSGSSSTSSSSSPGTKKHPSLGIDKFYDGSFDRERKKYIYNGDGDGSNGGDIYATITRDPSGKKVTLHYRFGNEPENRKPITTVSTGATGNGNNSTETSEYMDIVFD